MDLGTAATYSVLAGTGVSNTGAATVLAGDLGLSSSGTIAGFPPGTSKGTIHDKDAAAQNAESDRAAAYEDAAAETSTDTFAGDQAGSTFTPGVHTTGAAFSNTGTITLDAAGDPNGVFVFQIGAALASAAASKVVLKNGALANNVYWQVVGAVSLGAGAKYVGTFLGAGAVALGEGASIKGRVLTPGTVALADSPFAISKDDLTAPVVSIDGGGTSFTNDTTPPISGNTDEPAGGHVVVTVAAQNLTTTIGSDGQWSVSLGALSKGVHHVVASVTDPSQNTGTATQTLTIDTTSPAVVIDGRANQATNNAAPTITGTTDEPVGTDITVNVDKHILTATAGAGGAWSIAPGTLSETSHSVVASVEDAAGNTGTARQILTVDKTKPVVGIKGGAARATKDTSPWTFGTTGEKAGTTVRVTLGGQHLRTTVNRRGTFGVSAKTLAKGTYTVIASIKDAAQNTGTTSQTLTIGTNPVAHKARYRPDAAIRQDKAALVGVRTYGSSANQRVTARISRPAHSVKFAVRLTNRGDTTDRVSVHGTSRDSKFIVTYQVGGTKVTHAVTTGKYRTRSLTPGTSTYLVIKIARTSAAHRGDHYVLGVRVASTHSPRKQDNVAAAVRI